MFKCWYLQVTLNKNGHRCVSTGRIHTKVASKAWVAEKVGPILKKYPNLGAKDLKERLEEKYTFVLSYATVWSGRQMAAERLFGSWEDSFEMLFRFKAEVELRSPGSVV